MENNVYTEIDSYLKLLNDQISIFSKLRDEFKERDKLIESQREQISNIQRQLKESTLDIKYSKTLMCFQRIDDMFRNLEANIASPNFQNNVNLAIEEVFRAYGYMFVDYTEQTKDFYDCEYQQPIKEPVIIFRAVGRVVDYQKREVEPVRRGKIFLPEITIK